MTPDQSAKLTPEDCVLLANIFESEVERLFPVPATVRLFQPNFIHGPLNTRELPAKYRKAVASLAGKTTPQRTEGVLFIPLYLTEGQSALFILSDIDPVLLRKFSTSWLLEFQQKVQRYVHLVRDAHVDVETGLYNGRGLDVILQHPPDPKSPYSLYVISTFFVRRTSRGNIQKLHCLASFFSTLAHSLQFFLGQELFALVTVGHKRQQRLAFAHHLQRRLKREGIQKIHVAFTEYRQGDKGVYNDAWQALAVAEERGPYGMCDAGVLRKAENHPFEVPTDDGVLKKIRLLWHGLNRFGLAIFSCDKEWELSSSLQHLVSSILAEGEYVLAFEPEHVFVLLPNVSPASCYNRVKELAEVLTQTNQLSLSAGVASFPCLQFTKTDIIRNCRKALLHASFFGPGSIVAFDHVSLNVSGDWYFDEGDFRKAVTEYSRGLKLKPGENNLLNSLGVALMEMKRHRLAIDSFTEVLANDSDNYMALVNLGYAYQVQKKESLALEFFEKAYTVQKHLNLSGVDVYPQLSRLYCRAGRYQQALPVLTRWQEAEEEGGEYMLYRLLGEAYMEIGEAAKAMQSLQRALQLYPYDVESMSLLGLLYVEQNEGEEAGHLLLEKALSIDNTNADSWYRHARAMFYLGRMKEAHDGVRKCLQLKRSHTRARFLLGKILMSENKTTQAAGVFRRILAMKNVTDAEKKEAEKAVSGLSVPANDPDNR